MATDYVNEDRVMFIDSLDEMRRALELSIHSRTQSECNRACDNIEDNTKSLI